MSEPKFCKDCKWRGIGFSYPDCNAPQNEVIRRRADFLVNGRHDFDRRFPDCPSARTAWLGCGRSARWFKPVDPPA